MMLADDAYWLTHNAWTGAARTSEQSAGVMVAAALLAELADADAIAVHDGFVVAVLPPPAGLDELCAAVAGQITAEQQRHPVASWLELLSADVCGRVAKRLIAAGLARPRKMGLRRYEVATAFTNDPAPGWVHGGLVKAVGEGLPLTDDQQFLVWLIWYSSMQDHPLDGIGPAAAERVTAQLQSVSGVRRLLLQAAVDAIRTVAVAR